MMKISIITAVFNRVRLIGRALETVQKQTYKNVEHIIIDGASHDGTAEFLRRIRTSNMVLISEPDHGIYDALNKGLRLSTGEILGILHSDDFYADEYVLADVASAFFDLNIEAVYGDLEYVAENDGQVVIRRWRPGKFKAWRLAWGWMPPHPTIFFRRRIFEKYGFFDTRYKISADYDFILRCFGEGRIWPHYIPRVLVKMRIGGKSNQSLFNIFRKTFEDYLILRRNKIGGIGALLWKNISKLSQFLA